MDCRRPVGLFVALLVTACGCTSSLPMLRTSGTRIDPDADMIHKAPTYVAFGDFRARSAEAPETTPEGKRQLREEAKLAYQKAIEVDPKYLPAYVSLARVQLASEDHPAATQTYGKALAICPGDSLLHFELGMCQCRMKEWPAALASMRKAMELEPSNRQYATGMGLALARAGQWDEAFAILERVNGQAKAHYDLARMLTHVGQQPDKALQHAAAAVAADPRFEAARTLLAELEQGKTKPPAPAPTPTPALKPVPQQIGQASPLPVSAATPGPTPPAAAPPAPTPLPVGNPQTASAAPEPIAEPKRSPVALPVVESAERKAEQSEAPPRTLPELVDRPIRVPPLPVIRLAQRMEMADNK